MRPALVLRSLPNERGDWLICMLSSQLHHEIPEFDEIVRDTDDDFSQTGLKTTSLIRVTRLAVVSEDLLHGAIGSLPEERLTKIRTRVADWIRDSQDPPESEEDIAEQDIQKENE